MYRATPLEQATQATEIPDLLLLPRIQDCLDNLKLQAEHISKRQHQQYCTVRITMADCSTAGESVFDNGVIFDLVIYVHLAWRSVTSV